MSTQKGQKMYTVKNPVDLCIDPGNGKTAVVAERYAPTLFPSVIQQTTDQRLDGKGSQGFVLHIERQNAQTGDYQDRKSFAIGETALLLPGLKSRDTSKNRIGSEYQLILILGATVKALSEMIDSSASEIKASVNWWLNCPPVFFNLAQKMYDLSGIYKVEYDRKIYYITGTVAWTYPEGAGAFACYALDAKGRFANPDFATGRSGIVDGGYKTVDHAVFQGPTLLENTAGSLTNSITGVYRLMQSWAQTDLNETWTEDETEQAIRNGYAILRETKEKVDLSDWVADLGSRLAELVERDIFQKEWNGLGDVDRVLLAGGCAYMIGPWLKEAYPNVIHLKDEYAHTQDLQYEMMNCVGALRMLLAERAAAK
jgi:hypothetical protein